jgi:hypothetical protein
MPDQKLSVSLNSTVVATTEQVSAHFADSVVILGFNSESYYSLDEVGLLVWNLLQEPCKVIEIRDAIFQEYEVDLAQCEHDLFALLEELAAKQLIDIDESGA